MLRLIVASLIGWTGALHADGASSVRFDFHNAPWNEVLDWVAKANELTIQLDATPGGKFDYQDPRDYSPADALDIVHGALLDRGITLMRTGGLIRTAFLGDDMPWELVPFVPADKLDRVAPHEIVCTTVVLHTLSGAEVAREVEPALTPRGKIVGNKLARRLIVYDRAGVCAQIRDLVGLMDPPLDSNLYRLRIYHLEHARAPEVEPIVRDLVGPVENAPPVVAGPGGMPGNLNPEALTKMFTNRKLLASFTPGYSLKGVGEEPTKDVPKQSTRVSVDPWSNSLFVLAEVNVLAKVDKIIRAADQPTAAGADPILLKSYPLAQPRGDEVARKLNSILVDRETLSISGVDRVLIVRGTKRHHEEIQQLLETMTFHNEATAGFPLQYRRAVDLAPQLERLFQLDGQQELRVVADGVENAILVRGTREQVEQVRRMLIDLGEWSPKSDANPGLSVFGGDRSDAPKSPKRP